MPMFLGRFSYSRDSIKALIDNPQDRTDAVATTAESVGCKLQGLWYSFGEFDGYFLLEAPDSASAVALSAAVGGSGALSKVETIPLVSTEEAMEAFRKAQSASYAMPGK
jgi:uncharacterized protein with GYD domain